MKKIRVLLVEDEPVIAADLQDRLVEMGFEVAQHFSSGEEAVLFMQQNNADLVLMDIQLEGAMDGIETAQKILEKYPSLPVIYLTSNADDATFERAKNTRPAAFLSKPFRGKDLKHAIELAINHMFSVTHSPATPENSNPYLFNDRLFVKIKDRMVRLFLTDILWLEADDYYCKLITREKEILIGQTLKQMGEALAGSPEFMRVHRSYIVNLSHVEEIGDSYLYINKKQIPLNKASKDELTIRFQKI